MSLELCAVIHFVRLKPTPNQAIFSELKKVHGKDVITLRAVEKWTAAFEGEPTDLADLPRSGRPRDTGNVGAGPALIKCEGYLSQEEITRMLGIHDKALTCILCDVLNRRNVNFKSGPHAPDNSHKTARVQASQ
jgi:hypothetical protein